jgi:protoporphyrinogen IX oxidase
MQAFWVTLHVLCAAIVIGVLFVQSLAVVMAQRLPAGAQRQGVRTLQGRVQRFVYYPILLVTLLTGLGNALAEDAFAQGRWLHWKLLAVVLLIGLGLATGAGIRAQRPLRPLALGVHIASFLVAGWIVYLAVLKPF